MSPGQPAIETKELTKRYGDFVALDRLTLSVERGQILGFVGPNGAGKTTTIKILVGLARPTSGTARVAGVDCVARPRTIKRLVGYMPDTFGGYDNMRVSEYLETAGADDFGDLYVEALSHGMKQRVALARTLLHDPEVLILDEPGNGLDPQARIEMRGLLLSLAEQGKTLLVTSHVLPELARVCHRVAIITQGRLRAFGTLEEIGRTISPLRPMEVLLTRPEQVAAAAEVIHRYLEPGAEISTSPAEATVRFRTARRDEELAGLLAALVRSGLAVEQFREVQTDLEEAFLSVAGSADRDQE